MTQHLQRIVEIQQRAQAITGGIFQLIFTVDAATELGVTAQRRSNCTEVGQEFCFVLAKLGNADWIGTIKHSTICKHQFYCVQHLIGIQCIHPGSVISADPANSCTRQRRRHRRDHPAIGF